MKNLKRVLSLALAGTMLSGMMVIGASAADFTDAEKIEHTDAVNTLVALNVINGKDDGSYDPTGIVTRAEMAKLITVALNGGKAPVIGTKTTPTYTDIDGHWAESYIEYCSNLGIINGRGDGTFAPDATVTGSEAAKMMLVAMGWDSTIFNFTGADWALNVGVEANKVELFEDLEDIDPSMGLTRDNTAQLIFNGILAPMMVKNPNMTITNGEITWEYRLQPGTTIFTEKFKGEEQDGILTYNSSSYDADKEEYTYTVHFTDKDGDAVSEEFVTANDYTDLFQQKVRVLYKSTKNETTVYGIFAKGGSVVVEGVVGNVSGLDDITATTSKIKVDGTTYKLDMKGSANDVSIYAVAEDTAVEFSDVKSETGYKAYTFRGIDNNDNGKIDTVVYFPFTVGKVSYVGRDSFKIGKSAAVEFEDVTVYEGIAKDDYVKVTAKENTANNTAVYEEITDLISGKITATKIVDDVVDKVKIDGEWYALVSDVTAELGNSYKNVPVVNGYIFDVTLDEGTVSIDDYAVVIKAEATATGLNDNRQAKLLMSDGSKVTVDVKDNYSSMNGKLVTFEVEDDVYTLTEVTTDKGAFDEVVSGSYEYKKDGKSKIGGKTIADDAVIFLTKDGTTGFKVITGAELKKTASITVNKAFAETNTTTGFGTITMAYVQGTVASTSDNLYGYVTGIQKVLNDDDEKVNEVTLWTVDGEVVVTTKKDIGDDLAKGNLVVYKVNGSGVMTSVKKITETDAIDTDVKAERAAISAYDGDSIQIEGSTKTYELTDDTTILYINSEDKAGVEGGKIALADENADGTIINNVYVAVNKNDEVVLLIVDDKNDME